MEAKLIGAGDVRLFFRADPASRAAGYPDGYRAVLRVTKPKKDAPENGALEFGKVAARNEFVRNANKADVKRDQWCILEIIARGNHLTVKLDGVVTAEFQDMANFHSAGCFAMRLWNPDTLLQVRRIEIKELPPIEPGWVPLFNGKDLSGWNDNGLPDAWKIEDGILTSAKKTGNLATKRNDFGDFHLRMELMANATTDATINFRGAGAVNDGYRAALGGVVGKFYPGWIAHNIPLDRFKNPKTGLAEPNTWFPMEIIAKGKHIVIKVNGKIAVDWIDDDWKAKRGVVSLHPSILNGLLKIRNIEIKELPPETSQAKPIFEEHFKNPVAKWFVGQEPWFKTGFEDGRYFMDLNPGHVRFAYQPPTSVEGDFVCEALGRVVGGPQSALAWPHENLPQAGSGTRLTLVP
jgi:hypothetical protein